MQALFWRKMQTLRFSLIVSAVVACLASPMLAWARAGVEPDYELAAAGGLLGFLIMAWKTILGIVMLPFSLYASFKLYCYIRARKKEAKKVLASIEHTDPIWQKEALLERVRDVYERVQEAWSEGNLEPVRELFTDKGYERIERKLRRMKSRGFRNVVENIDLDEVSVVEVKDFKDDAKDSIWVLIKGEALDYYIREKDGLVQGDDEHRDSFTDLWRFVRGPDNQWVVAEMRPDPGPDAIQRLHSFTELEIGQSSNEGGEHGGK